jgi:hypothetical protein
MTAYYLNRYERGIWDGNNPVRFQSLEAAKAQLGPDIQEAGKPGQLCAIVRSAHAPNRPVYLYRPN